MTTPFKSIMCLISIFAAARLTNAAEPPSKADPSKWKLVWSDEFDGDRLDRNKWTFDQGNGYDAADVRMWISGWGNNEQQFYTDRAENSFVKDGLLHIVADREIYKACPFTSARLCTRGLFSKQYGRFEFRAKFPTGKGLWPAIWLLPAENAYGVWAASGEIDVVEARGQRPQQILGSLNYGSRWPGNDFTEADTNLPDNGTIADFHTYALEWQPGEMRWYVDDHLYSTKRHWWSSGKQNANHEGVKNPAPADLNAWPAPYDKPFYLIMNLAVGGDFVGNPDDNAVFPQEMLVDYVRVYDRINGYGPTPPPGEDQGIEKPHPDPLSPKPSPKNLALRKPTTASSEELPDHLAANVNDGDLATRWCAANGDVPQTWQVDLQNPTDLSGLQIVWEMDNRNYQYIVEGSANASNWQTLSDQSNNTSMWQTQQLSFNASDIRYVRIRITGLEPGSWASIDEVTVLGK